MTYPAIFWAKPRGGAVPVVVSAIVLLFHALQFPVATAEQTAVESLEITQPRDFGYQLGDKFERHIMLRINRPYELELESIPKRGRLNQWVSFDSSDIKQKVIGNVIQYDIRFGYQVINIDPEISNIDVPHHELAASDGVDTVKFLVRASRTTISPLMIDKDDVIRPDITPALQSRHYLKSALLGILFLFSLIGLYALHRGLPFSSKSRPFTDLYHQFRKHRHSSWTDENYANALHSIHNAFNRTAGKTVFMETLDQFFAEHQRFVPLKESIEVYFSRSNQYFFGEGAAAQQSYTVGELESLAKRCSDAERGLA